MADHVHEVLQALLLCAAVSVLSYRYLAHLTSGRRARMEPVRVETRQSRRLAARGVKRR